MRIIARMRLNKKRGRWIYQRQPHVIVKLVLLDWVLHPRGGQLSNLMFEPDSGRFSVCFRYGRAGLNLQLPKGGERSSYMLQGLCDLTPAERAAWFIRHAKRIRQLLPPIARLAFDRWYRP